MPGMTAGELVRLREAMGLSVKELADLVGVDGSAVYRWESGRCQVKGKRVKERLRDLWRRQFGPAMDYPEAQVHVARVLGLDIDAAAHRLTEYGRLPGEPWESVAARVVDGERFKLAEAARK
jgi:transcriptional regulator with XRE-family HTH domain